MRLFPFVLLVLLVGLLGMLGSCGGPLPENVHVIRLTDSIVNPLRSNYQLYWTIADTTAWENTLAAADTIYEEGNYRKLRSKQIWYEMRREKGEWRSNQHYPGWKRRIDSVSRRLNVIRMLDNNRVRAEIPAADVIIGRDSFRIGIIKIVGKAFGWQDFDATHPDYLILTTYGNRLAPIVMDQDNIGGISRKTVFRVGRRYYVLKSVTEDRREIIIEETDVGREFPLSAELDLYFKQIPVLALDSTRTTVRHTPGKDLMVYFTHGTGDDILRIDSLYQAMPKNERDKLDVAVISRNTFREAVRDFVAANNVQLPVYVATDKTCKRLNCHPWMPYYVGVSERGRINTFYGWQQWLEERLGVFPDTLTR